MIYIKLAPSKNHLYAYDRVQDGFLEKDNVMDCSGFTTSDVSLVLHECHSFSEEQYLTGHL